MPVSTPSDERYLQIVENRIEVCKAYRPKFGMKGAVSAEEFKALYNADIFYHWFGLSNPLLYAAHKAAGGLTSLYRQVGLGCERLVRQILCDQLDLTIEQVAWSYTAKVIGRKNGVCSLWMAAFRFPNSRIRPRNSGL